MKHFYILIRLIEVDERSVAMNKFA